MAANSRAPTSSKSDSCSARPELTTTTAQQHHAVRCSRHQGQMSGHNLHRRATVSELQALFDRSPAAGGPNTPDPVGHWYEAQLLHYGLAPSKNKAVAKVRLLDALRAGSLNVPKDILKVEGDLKKEWKKKDKETKSGSGSDSGGTAKSSTSGNNKRKRDDKDAGETAQTPKATAKKIKTADLAATKTETETGQKSSQSAKSSSTKKGSGGKAATAKKNEPQKESEPAPKRQTAKRGGSTASSKTKPPAISSQGPEPKAAPKRQTARRSKPFFGGRLPTDPAIKQEYYNTPPLGSMHPSDADSMGVPSDEDDWSDNGPEDASNMPLPPLGLINGEYQIYSQDLNDWSDYPEEEFNLILGLAGISMWGSYDFGIFYGIMHLQERPWSSSSRRIPFEWRGRDRGEGEMSFGPSCTGWISFLGDGHIQDQLGGCHGEGKFSGDRISGNKTQPPRDVRSMREEWNGYNQVEYDNENRRRWGGW